MNPLTRTLCVLAVLVTGLSGCGGLSRPYPEKSLHALDVGSPEKSEAAKGTHVLKVENVWVADPFSALTFNYKVGESKFTSDYYNGFIAPPGRMLTGNLSSWLAASGIFSAVVSGENSADYDFVLETNVTALYGDYSDSKSPLAVIEAKFFLIDESGGRFVIAFQKQYRENEPISAISPDELVRGWDRGYRRMLESLSADLSKVSIVQGAAAER